MPLRTCVGCRERAPAGALLRVVAVDGRLVPDLRRVLPGRGAHLHPRATCLQSAVRRKVLPRALRTGGALDLGDLERIVAEWPDARRGLD